MPVQTMHIQSAAGTEPRQKVARAAVISAETPSLIISRYAYSTVLQSLEYHPPIRSCFIAAQEADDRNKNI